MCIKFHAKYINCQGYAVIQTDVFDKIRSFSPDCDTSHSVKFSRILMSKWQYFETMQKCVSFVVYTALSMKVT